MSFFALVPRETVAAVGKHSVQGSFSQELPSHLGKERNKTRNSDIVWRLDGDFLHPKLGNAFTLDLMGKLSLPALGTTFPSRFQSRRRSRGGSNRLCIGNVTSYCSASGSE